MSHSLSTKDQIEIVLSGFNHPAMKAIGGNLGQIAKALTVTADEIRNYVKESGYPKCLTISTTPGSEDVYYIVEKNSEYELYSQTRGVESNKRTFATYKEAEMALAEDFIQEYLSFK